MEPPDPKPPLEYRNYSDDRPDRLKNAGAMVMGILLGGYLTAFVGCANFSIDAPPSHSANQKMGLVAGFAIAAVITSVLAGFVLKRQPRRFLLGGFLLGIALTSIIEGVCFFG